MFEKYNFLTLTLTYIEIIGFVLPTAGFFEALFLKMEICLMTPKAEINKKSSLALRTAHLLDTK